MIQAKILSLSFCIIILLAPSVTGNITESHPVSVTRTYAYVTREKADVKVQAFLEDLFLFHGLKPNDQDFLEPDIIQVGIEKHKDFLLEKFVLRDLSGKRLRGRILEVEKIELPAEGVALGELMAHTVVFQLRYDFESPPEFLTISQHFTDTDGLIPSEMNLVLKQENAGDSSTFTLKPDDPETVRFNWNNPPLSAEASEEERKKWVDKQKEETLGITSYSSVYSFLYIDGREIRHEILIPLLTLEESILIARDDDEFLDIAEQDAARQQIEAFFKSGNPIAVDGIQVTPIVERCDFYGLNFKDFAKQAESKPVGLASARVGIILSYPSPVIPETVDLTWNRFNNFIWTINMVVFAFDEVSKVTLSRLDSSNAYRWENPGQDEQPPVQQVNVAEIPPPTLSLPTVTLGCAILCLIVLMVGRIRRANKRFSTLSIVGLLILAVASWPWFRWEVVNPLHLEPSLTDTESDTVFAALHHNLYRAFDFHNEEEIYDALAKSIDGDLLAEVYLQIQRGLKMQEQGGAVSRIRDIEILEGNRRPEAPLAQQPAPSREQRLFRYQCRWNVSGTVEHWGHIHARTNQYEAVFDIAVRDDAWKITDMQLLAENRVSFETKLRELK